MEHLDLVFILIGVGCTCYGFMDVLLKMEYQSRRKKRSRTV